jgi:N-methylhydantoinase A/oxoprolinase/acetone carboxylase beta subunit
VTTRGFKDILVLQRQTRPNVNSIVCRKPEPLVPLRLTVEATERVSVEGDVIVPLDERVFLEALDASWNRKIRRRSPSACSTPTRARRTRGACGSS